MIGVAGAAPVAVLPAVAAAGLLTTWVFPGDGSRVATDGGEELLDDDAEDLDLDGDGLDGLELDEGEDLDMDAGDGGLDMGSDDGGGGAAGQPDLEPRVDELEAQLENVSGQVSSAQHESEELREAMERIEDNVRQLLDIYALVTKDANPFTDDSGGPMDMDIGETLDIFDTDEEEEDDEAMADTDDMMDDLDDMEAEAREELEDDVEDAAENLDDAEEDSEAEAEDEPEEGTTFDDLKSEYESDEALEGVAEEDDVDDEDEPDPEEEALAEDGEDDAPDGEFEFGHEPATAEGAKPYLETLPDGYATDVLVMEWLEYLVGQSDPRRAARAIDRYESLGWLGAPAAGRLRAILSGSRFDGAGSGGSLSADSHRRSLEYIARLSDGPFGDPASMIAASGGSSRAALRSDGGDR